ncbi:asparagine synthase-related protein [Colwellia psychrerythraea]|uniref:Asparagine synthetase domain-containing protein n=1 Tax=Colwellia psychrerythraea (strain 34H / ATCC BAA-681) TaxID=167879 RepID=Q489D1_COLP3|nr:asparagine synthase-related protein [Colwellia psychrerythraea]AAZ24796.1 hypothetical protein CPS_0583 [Colwellia psychrerythraea 34H]
MKEIFSIGRNLTARDKCMNGNYNKNYIGNGSHLGTIYPLFSKESPSDFFFNMEDIINFRTKNNLNIELDKVALVEKACLPYLLGNRTLITDVERAPWMHSYSNQRWINESLPYHGKSKPNKETFVCDLKTSLSNEAIGYIGKANTVGILLSGGMDSRVVAGVVRDLQKNNRSISVVGITWGNANSRDVIYSQRICQQFGWEFVHFPITAETLHKNIQLSAKMGAEVSALHFHAMSDVADLKGVDVILAGSYGDSVGRAEFSGKHVTKLSSVLPSRINNLGLIKDELFQSALESIRNDAQLPAFHNAGDNNLRKYEIEQECHYMRRMLQSCMHVVAEKIPFYQMFTAPSVFGLMWGLEPNIRNNDWYVELLNILPGQLLQIPWARTGILYHLPEGTADEFDKSYHQYGLWLKTELKDEMLNAMNSKSIRELGIFNEYSLDALVSSWGIAKGASNNRLDEVVSWIASLNTFINNNQSLNLAEEIPYKYSDYYNTAKGSCYGMLYSLARNYLRK